MKKKVNAKPIEEEVQRCPKCSGEMLKSGSCAAFLYCKECGWVIRKDS